MADQDRAFNTLFRQYNSPDWFSEPFTEATFICFGNDKTVISNNFGTLESNGVIQIPIGQSVTIRMAKGDYNISNIYVTPPGVATSEIQPYIAVVYTKYTDKQWNLSEQE